MELKDFIRETLTQICEGVEESLVRARETGGYVNPATTANSKSNDSSHFANIGHGRNVFLVDFSVAVSVEENLDKNAHAKLKVASVLSLGVGGDVANKSSATNQISFKVPLALPVDPITQDELKAREKANAQRMQTTLNSLNSRARGVL